MIKLQSLIIQNSLSFQKQILMLTIKSIFTMKLLLSLQLKTSNMRKFRCQKWTQSQSNLKSNFLFLFLQPRPLKLLSFILHQFKISQLKILNLLCSQCLITWPKTLWNWSQARKNSPGFETWFLRLKGKYRQWTQLLHQTGTRTPIMGISHSNILS